jgi:hypothetical protein
MFCTFAENVKVIVEKYGLPTASMDNIIAALEHRDNDRVLKSDLRRLEPSPEMESVEAVIQEPFPSLILHTVKSEQI